MLEVGVRVPVIAIRNVPYFNFDMVLLEAIFFDQ